MKQRAITAGVLSNPYRFVNPGEEFDHDDAMVWAEPVESDEPEPEQTRRRGRAKSDPPAEDVI